LFDVAVLIQPESSALATTVKVPGAQAVEVVKELPVPNRFPPLAASYHLTGNAEEAL
jgi:hypothetical protein